MKVLSCIAKPSQDGTKTYYTVALEKADGTQIGAFAFEAVNPGDQVEDSRIIPGKREGEWTLKSAQKAGKPGGNWQRNDNLIVAQCAAKIAADLWIAGKVNPVKMVDFEQNCIAIGRAIKATEAAISGTETQTKIPTTPVASKPELSGIKNMGMLRKAISDTYPTCKTVAAQDKILGTEPITDFDGAFKKVADYMEGLQL